MEGTITVSNGHWRCTPVRVRKCRPIWRRPENQRRDRKLLTEMNDEPRNTPMRQEKKPQIQDGVCIAMKRQIKCGGQKGCMACSRHAGANPRDLRTRSQDTVNNEDAQTDRARSNVSPGETVHSSSKGTMQSSNGGTATAAGRPAPKDSHVVMAAVAESSMTRSMTSSTIREVETEDQSKNTECQKVLASRSDRHRKQCEHGHVQSDRPDDRSRRLRWMDSAGCGLEQEMLWSQEWTSWTPVVIKEGERKSNQGACEH